MQRSRNLAQEKLSHDQNISACFVSCLRRISVEFQIECTGVSEWRDARPLWRLAEIPVVTTKGLFDVVVVTRAVRCSDVGSDSDRTAERTQRQWQ